MKKRLQKFFLMVVAALGWVLLTVMFARTSFSLATMQAKSTVVAMLVIAVFFVAVWTFYSAFRKSRLAGASTYGELYKDLGMRFCITPLLAFGLIMLAAMQAA